MKIKELNIIQFGKFKDKVIRLSEGLNIVRGDNESGKSTLLAFIKFALYGVGRKNPNVAVGERERAVSWNTGLAAGSLTVEDEEGNEYRIERIGREGARGTFTDKVRVIDLENGNEVFSGEVPGEHFLGINAQAYDSMCNIKQLETVMLNGDAVKGVIDNLLSAGDESTDVKGAIKMLDAERRRILHVNGKGGLMYESETALERLRSEHRGAILQENENAKNIDELERVELALAKSKEEFEIAQRMCDTYDDVVRLGKFAELRELQKSEGVLKDKIRELDLGASFDTKEASYESLALAKSTADALTRAENEHSEAKRVLDVCEKDLGAVTYQNSGALSEVIEEYGSPSSADAYFGAKLRKQSNSLFLFASFGIVGGILLVFAAILAFAMNNTSGALTVAFLGAVISSAAIVFYNQYATAKREIEDFVNKMGEGFSAKNAPELKQMLEKFNESRAVYKERSTALEGAKMRLSMSEQMLTSERIKAASLLSKFGISTENGGDADALKSLADKMKNYLDEKGELEDSAKQNSALIKSLSIELERFNEDAIRARLTPEIEEKIKNTPFDRLKAERDLALHRTNQYGQYKAAIERGLASSGTRRPSSEIFPEIEAEEERFEALKLRFEAIRLAMETVNLASQRIKSDITPRIKDRAQQNLATITDGKYSELYVDENMSLSVFAGGATRHIDSLSKGSLDAAYFSVRLALIETLLGDKNPPLYMDECLSQLDDGRAKNTLRAIADHAENAQCVLFTCQNRDVELAQAVTDVNVIEI